MTSPPCHCQCSLVSLCSFHLLTSTLIFLSFFSFSLASFLSTSPLFLALIIYALSCVCAHLSAGLRCAAFGVLPRVVFVFIFIFFHFCCDACIILDWFSANEFPPSRLGRLLSHSNISFSPPLLISVQGRKSLRDALIRSPSVGDGGEGGGKFTTLVRVVRWSLVSWFVCVCSHFHLC